MLEYCVLFVVSSVYCDKCYFRGVCTKPDPCKAQSKDSLKLQKCSDWGFGWNLSSVSHTGGTLEQARAQSMLSLPSSFLSYCTGQEPEDKRLGYFKYTCLSCLCNICCMPDFTTCMQITILYCFCGLATKLFWLPTSSKSLVNGKLFLWLLGMECKFNSSSLK